MFCQVYSVYSKYAGSGMTSDSGRWRTGYRKCALFIPFQLKPSASSKLGIHGGKNPERFKQKTLNLESTTYIDQKTPNRLRSTNRFGVKVSSRGINEELIFSLGLPSEEGLDSAGTNKNPTPHATYALVLAPSLPLSLFCDLGEKTAISVQFLFLDVA